MKMLNKRSSKTKKVVSLVLALVFLLSALVINTPNASKVNAATKGPYLSGFGHVQNIGWDSSPKTCGVNGSFTLGTTGQSLRLEAVKLGIHNVPYRGGIYVQVRYFDGTTCGQWASVNNVTNICGTEGQSKPIEAIKVYFTDQVKDHYGLKYRVHVQNLGWQGWVSSNTWAGTQYRQLRVEALQIQLTR